MVVEYELNATAMYRGRPVTVISRVYVGGEWLYGLRLANGRVVDYIPGRSLKVAA
jgi:hypothetical protein